MALPIGVRDLTLRVPYNLGPIHPVKEGRLQHVKMLDLRESLITKMSDNGTDLLAEFIAALTTVRAARPASALRSARPPALGHALPSRGHVLSRRASVRR